VRDVREHVRAEGVRHGRGSGAAGQDYRSILGAYFSGAEVARIY
jgi:hypothetical protein